MKYFIASSKTHAGKITEDILIAEELAKRGYESQIVPWEELPGVVQLRNTVILKSIWGYHQEYESFVHCLEALAHKQIHIINSHEVVMWNIDKHQYLTDLKENGIDIVDYILVPAIPDNVEVLLTIVRKAGAAFTSQELVLKPIVSASGHKTYRLNANKISEAEAAAILADISDYHSAFMFAPFLSGITEGELSIVVLGGELQYGIIRYPGVLSEKQDSRFISLDAVPEGAIVAADKLIAYLSRKFSTFPIILRIDFILHQGEYKLLECELIDPDLYFRSLPAEQLSISLDKFVTASTK